MRKALVLCGLVAAAVVAATVGVHTAGSAASGCQLQSATGQIKHVIYIQFDNTHYRRDNPNVASDLEQMPNLLNFIKGNGTLFTNDHTILISHTAGGILSTLTGLYPDRTGQAVSNSYRYFTGNTSASSSSFKYWTDLVDDTNGTADPKPNMVTDTGKTTPAPWVPFTRAGCDVGGVSTANIELENTGTGSFGDMTEAFGAGSPEVAEARATPALAQTDFVGIAVHCSKASTSVCNGAAHTRPDSLPDEPGGYTGFNALFGAKYVDPAITPDHNACVKTVDSSANITDAVGTCGFPGFDGAFAKNTLGYVAQMQEAGVPVTIAYISDAHDIHVPNTGNDSFASSAAGPGEATYKAQLAAYNTAFGQFFERLADHGINKSNTLFVFTVDEGDHFAGGVGTPQPDGSLAYTHTSCSVLTACPSNQIGEVNLDLRLATGRSDFFVHSDDAPTVYVNGNPARTDPSVRSLEHSLANLTEPDPYFNNGQVVHVAQAFADPVEEKTLHMVTADPQRTPTFTLFGNADFFMTASGSTPSCGANPCVSPGFAWNHGDFQEEIGNTWLGMVGPGVDNDGVDSTTWTDHTNVRPTIMTLVGLQDDYVLDGRPLIEALAKKAIPESLFTHQKSTLQLAQAYEQLNASFGSFAQDTLKASTKAIVSNDDATYNSIESSIATLTAQRDSVASKIRADLNAMAFDNKNVPDSEVKSLTDQAQSLIDDAQKLAST
jgi:hypothetical protein